ncbi:MAG: HigA family addiction module antitoxin [Pseudomonadota bacterium]
MSKKALPPVHPGETLLEDLMKPLGLSRNKLAAALGVDTKRINEIVTKRRSITGDTALRLARYFGTSPEFWMNLQARYDLELAKDAKAEEIERTVLVKQQTENEVHFVP